MKILRKATLLASIFLILVSITSTWMIMDSYMRYGWSWEVKTIIKGENETHVETLASMIGFSFAFWLLTALTLANYRELRISKQRTTGAQQSRKQPPE